MSSHRWRPSWRLYLATARTGLIVVGIAVIAGLVALIITRNPATLAVPIVVTVTGLSAFGCQLLRIHRSWLEIDQDSLTWHGVLGRRRLRLDRIRGVLAPIAHPKTMATARLLLVTDGRQRVRVSVGIWEDADLTEIADVLGLEQSWVPLDALAVEQGLPGSTNLALRHPLRLGFGLALAIVVVVAVAVVAVTVRG